MKELSIEEKAYDSNYKTYTELINRLEGVKDAIKKQNYGIAMDILCKPYPEYQIITSTELKESEDEKIRKAIKLMYSFLPNEPTYIGDVPVKDIFAWLEKQGKKDEEILILKDQIESLHAAIKAIKETHRIELEKQGEQKPTIEMKTPEESLGIDSDTYNKIVDECIYGEQKLADKVEPKFKNGDWVKAISSGNIFKILSVNDGLYRVLCYDGVEANYPIEVEKDLAYWTIQDAKKGDILSDGTIVLIVDSIGEFEGKPIINSWYFADSKKFYGKGTSDCDKWEIDSFRTATKAECNYLLKMMADAGYVFDFEKKELKKVEQKPAWSEEDETGWTNTMIMIKECAANHYTKDNIDLVLNWLKSLKDRVQPKQELNENDEKIVTELIGIFESAVDGGHVTFPYRVLKDYIRVLKSCLHQSSWKPSDKQMDAIKDAIDYLGCTKIVRGYLVSLYEDLKKLREK